MTIYLSPTHLASFCGALILLSMCVALYLAHLVERVLDHYRSER